MEKEKLFLTEKNNPSSILSQNLDSSGLVLNVSATSLLEGNEIRTARPIAWINPEKSSFSSYVEMESALENTGIFTPTALLPHGTYVVSLSEATSTTKDVLSLVANSLEFNTSFNPIVLD